MGGQTVPDVRRSLTPQYCRTLTSSNATTHSLCCPPGTSYEALGLCGVGQSGKMIDAGDNTYGGQCACKGASMTVGVGVLVCNMFNAGKYVVNPSGGLIAKGHPLGATGVAQCCELNWQLRGEVRADRMRGLRVSAFHVYSDEHQPVCLCLCVCACSVSMSVYARSR